ncbi:integral peroxisomal membrane peroxin-domain-containing protein [Coprinopsis sp. MPI-PUGE-AT-0042]|nr:integral peroxisomal membrane peroxin-domain-containing protein [Coprinopsis sp. MPI-PUGE-AT-0042]
MATLDYANIPAGATRLRSSPNKPTSRASADIRPAPTVFTSLPNPSPPHTPRHRNQMSLPAAPASPAMGFFPQLLLSAALPGIPAPEEGSPPGNSAPGATNPRQKLEPEKYTLLSTKDPLSLPIMTNNFKRFVSKIGPVFWLQDRGEEILLWKRGWKVTSTWMALYAFLCYYPKFILMLPHAAAIAIILATYPYPKSGEPFAASASSSPGQDTTAQPAPEGSIPWQANIQAIQNLMGVVSDAFEACEPYVHHVVLSPAHFKDTPTAATKPSSLSSPKPTQLVSPYTPHVLTLLVCTFPILAFIVALPSFPIRETCLVAGLSPFVATHPRVQGLFPYILPVIQRAAPLIVARARLAHGRLLELASMLKLVKKREPSKPSNEPSKPAAMVIQRMIDNDRLTDKTWNSEIAEVDLWENERLDSLIQHDPHAITQTSPWSKSHLKPGERAAWTRGRDGWNGVGTSGMASGIEASGEVSSNLTFSLAPGWSFVETEDWRKDLTGEWSGVGADEDGWVYSNDSWLGPRPSPYSAGGGSATRRRRWTRRVWYDPELAKQT